MLPSISPALQYKGIDIFVGDITKVAADAISVRIPVGLKCTQTSFVGRQSAAYSSVNDGSPKLDKKIVDGACGLVRDVLVNYPDLDEDLTVADWETMSSMTYHERADYLVSRFGYLEPEL